MPTSSTTPEPTLRPVRRARPRLTGRGMVLVLVMAVLVVSYASSLRAYLVQREHIADVKAEIAVREDNIAALEREQRRWEDPTYLQSQARERFGYLMPGETGYQVLDEDGRPIDEDSLPTDGVDTETPTAWWDTVWESVEYADAPPSPDELEPADRIGPNG